MSLINDALKKVSEAERRSHAAAQGQNAAAAAPDFEAQAMQPVHYDNRASHWLWISVASFVAAVGVAIYLYALSLQPTSLASSKRPSASRNVAKQAATAAVEAPTPQPAVAVAAAVPAQSTVSNTIANAPPAPVVPAAPAPTQPAPVVALVPAVVPVGPVFRLKGILYTKNPTALINEASVQAGGEVDGATVTKIDATAVTLEYQGTTTVLKLGAK
jgi:hypothetical protein